MYVCMYVFPIEVLYEYSLLVEADVDCHRLT